MAVNTITPVLPEQIVFEGWSEVSVPVMIGFGSTVTVTTLLSTSQAFPKRVETANRLK